MANNYVVIDGITINLSDETVNNLKKELGIKKELKFGDIVECHYGKRIILFNEEGELETYNKNGHSVGGPSTVRSNYYKFTGKNIFKDNLLNLNY